MDKKLETAVDRIAGLIDYGHLLSSTDPTELLNQVADKFIEYKADAEKWRRVVEIAGGPCTLNACPLFKRCTDLPCLAQTLVDALSKRKEEA